MIKVFKFDETYIRIECDDSIAQELSEHFSFMVPNARWMPSFKNKLWDGKIRLFNTRNRRLYAGLRQQVEQFCKSRDYEYEEEPDFAADSFSISEAKDWIKTQDFSLQPRDYQIDAFCKGIRNRRALFLSPTASGKSFIIWLLTAYLRERTLIVVPTTSLVSQMAKDFVEYSPGTEVHQIYSGKEKQTDKLITITTWQSIYKMDKKWFNNYKVIIGDEAHLFKANSLTSIMEKTVNVPYKFGFTGTLDGSLTNKMVLEGLFGPVDRVITTTELMERKDVANLRIKCIVLEYPDMDRQTMRGSSYQDEVDYIVTHSGRNKFIANLANSLEGNVLVLFRYIEKQGDVLAGLIKAKAGERSGVYYVTGGVEAETRERVRTLVDSQQRAIIVASFGVFSTGINIKNINYIILASPAKSRITVLQSIGRGLRKSETKSDAVWFDIADDLSWKSYKNHTIKHYAERIKIYNDENFSYKQYKVKIK